MSELRKVITSPGEVIDFETVFEENPALRTGVPTKKGTVERVEYTTDVYGDGKTYSKYCYVYLPYGYDAADKSKRYNVLYFQHGNTCCPDMFAVGGNKYMFDMLFESGEIEPCIIAFVTYYFDPIGESEVRMRTGMASAGDGIGPNAKCNYCTEVIESIIPAVEARYNTYLENTSPEGIRAARDHRAFSGYSRGAVATWRMLNKCFDYFRWYAPMSCMTHCDRGVKDIVTPEEVIEYVTSPVRANPDLPFFIYATNGGDSDIAEMTEQMKYLTKQDCFSYGTDPAKNNFYFSRSDYYHTDYLVPYYLWNSLKVLFRGM